MISHEGLPPCSNECPCPDQAPGPAQMLRGPVPSGQAAPALCHAHCPVLPAAISAVKTTDRFWINLCQSYLATLHPTHVNIPREVTGMGPQLVKQLMQQ